MACSQCLTKHGCSREATPQTELFCLWCAAADEEDIFLLPEDEEDDWFMAPQITSGLDQGAIRLAVDDDIIELPVDDISDTTSPYYEVANDMDIDRLWDLLMTGPVENTVEIPEEQVRSPFSWRKRKLCDAHCNQTVQTLCRCDEGTLKEPFVMMAFVICSTSRGLLL